MILFDVLKVSAGAIPTLESGSLFQFESPQIQALANNAVSLIDSFMPIVLLVGGLSLGMYIIWRIIGIFGGAKKREEEDIAERKREREKREAEGFDFPY